MRAPWPKQQNDNENKQAPPRPYAVPHLQVSALVTNTANLHAQYMGLTNTNLLISFMDTHNEITGETETLFGLDILESLLNYNRLHSIAYAENHFVTTSSYLIKPRNLPPIFSCETCKLSFDFVPYQFRRINRLDHIIHSNKELNKILWFPQFWCSQCLCPLFEWTDWTDCKHCIK